MEFFGPRPNEAKRASISGNTLTLAASGTAPVDFSPLLLIAGDTHYKFESDVEINLGPTAGLLLLYDGRLYCGHGSTAIVSSHQYGAERGRPTNPHGRSMRIRVTNDRHIVHERRRRPNLAPVRSRDGSVGLPP